MLEGVLMLAADDPLHHNYDYPILSINGFAIFTNHTLMMLIVAGVMLWALPAAAARIRTGSTGTSHDYVPGNPFAHLIEVFCVFFRDQVAKPVLGHNTDHFMPFIWTVFFFILFNNLLGLVPLLDLTSMAVSPFLPGGGYEAAAVEGSRGLVWFEDPVMQRPYFHGIGGTATGNIFVTGALALISLCVIVGGGIRGIGLHGFFHHLTLGAPVFLWPLTIFLEVLGLVAKPFALMVRLFANMTAGHVLLSVLLGFTGMAIAGTGPFFGTLIAIPSLLFALAIGLLELLIAFIQAYIFTYLTTMFISLFQPHEHHEHEHHIGDEAELSVAPETEVTTMPAH